MDSLFNLTDRVVLITGASRGIGAAAAKLFARAGAKVAINYRKNEKIANKLVDEIKTDQHEAIAVKADVSDRGQVEKMIRTVINAYNRIDVLVNNAGIWTYGAIADMEIDVWETTMKVNLDSIYYCCQAVIPEMKKHGGGRIINISSTAGQRGEAFHSHYAATKGAVISFSKSLAAELAPDNILVNTVAPGWAVTDMTADALAEEPEQIFSVIPLHRAGTAQEMAGAILFLASDLATYITGEVINVNGGSVLCG
jgi:3-oxoacyl-[acyl-carrier protein] reductase